MLLTLNLASHEAPAFLRKAPVSSLGAFGIHCAAFLAGSITGGQGLLLWRVTLLVSSGLLLGWHHPYYTTCNNGPGAHHGMAVSPSLHLLLSTPPVGYKLFRSKIWVYSSQDQHPASGTISTNRFLFFCEQIEVTSLISSRVSSSHSLTPHPHSLQYSSPVDNSVEEALASLICHFSDESSLFKLSHEWNLKDFLFIYSVVFQRKLEKFKTIGTEYSSGP